MSGAAWCGAGPLPPLGWRKLFARYSPHIHESAVPSGDGALLFRHKIIALSQKCRKMINWDKAIEYFLAAVTTASAGFAAISLGIGVFEGKLSGIIAAITFVIVLFLLSMAQSPK